MIREDLSQIMLVFNYKTNKVYDIMIWYIPIMLLNTRTTKLTDSPGIKEFFLQFVAANGKILLSSSFITPEGSSTQ